MEQAPRRANPGLEGEEIWVWLRLKTLADVGLLGLPNVGKSSLLSAITNAKPKIGNYAYTTLTPQLGIIRNYDQEIILADIPGLISDAHKGVGIGTRFLGHIERCKILLHVIDADSENHIKAYQSIMKEIKAYGKELKDKKQILVISKADLIEKKELTKIIKKIENYTKSSVIVSSSLNKEGLDTIINTLYSCMNKHKEENNNKEIKEKKWSP
jgi:GTP-binding protein